jgi:hypothetical protein
VESSFDHKVLGNAADAMQPKYNGLLRTDESGALKCHSINDVTGIAGQHVKDVGRK